MKPKPASNITNDQTRYLPVLVSACFLLMLSFGYRAGFGLFLQPMSEANGWGRDVFSLALAIQNLAWGAVAVLAGGLADRFGNLKVLLAGVLFYGVGMLLMAHSAEQWQLISSAGLLVGAGIAGTSFGIVLPSIARAVPEEKRGWALGLGTAAGSFGQFLLVPIMQQLIELSGWFMALQLLGICALLMAIFALPLTPFGGANSASSQPQELSLGLMEVLRRALTVPSYSLLTIGFFVCGFHVAFITVHMPGYLVDKGFVPQVGAWSLSMIGLCNVIGAYCSGLLSSRRPMARILSLIYAGRVVAISLFVLLPMSLTSVLVFSACMGFLWLATVPPTSGLVAALFGTRYMSFLYGVVFFSHQLGSFSGVWLGGWLYQRFGSYDGIWYCGIALGALATLLHIPIKQRSQQQLLTVS
ncbi:MFS transporter [Aliagarivorans marinus]|uniref:MFS transporter n=1 Tax=Aliagarivorans marinus TaxID=561965 RepID=UPI00040C1F11|nr:MFS transporter [Aliagarivorans marinus]